MKNMLHRSFPPHPQVTLFSADAFGSPTRGIPGSTLLAISIFLGWIDTRVTKNHPARNVEGWKFTF